MSRTNYMFAPPPGVYPRALPLLYYRSFSATAGIAIAAAMRYGLAAPLATLGGALAVAAHADAGGDSVVDKAAAEEGLARIQAEAEEDGWSVWVKECAVDDIAGAE